MKVISEIINKIRINKVNVYILLFLVLAVAVNFLTLNQISHELEGFSTGIDLQDPFQIFIFPLLLIGMVFVWVIATFIILIPNTVIFIMLTLLSLVLKDGLYSFNIADKEDNELLKFTELALIIIVICIIGQIFGKLMNLNLRQIFMFANLINIVVAISLRSIIQYFIFKYVAKNPKFNDKPKIGLIGVLSIPIILYVLITFIYNIMQFLRFK